MNPITVAWDGIGYVFEESKAQDKLPFLNNISWQQKTGGYVFKEFPSRKSARMNNEVILGL